METSQKIKNGTSIQYIISKSYKLSLTKKTFEKIYASLTIFIISLFINISMHINNKDMEPTQMPNNKLMNKELVINTHTNTKLNTIQ